MCYSHAQIHAIDSLKGIFENIENDSLAFSKLNESANFYRNRNAALHLFVVKTGILRASSTKSLKEEANFKRELGIYYRKKGDLDSAIIHYHTSLQIHSSLKDSMDINIVKSSLANAFKAKGDYQNAIKYFNEIAAYFDRKGEKFKMRKLITKFNLAGVYISMQEWETADMLLEKVYDEPETQKNKSLVRATAINLCATKQKIDQLDKALSYARIAEKLENNPRSLADLSINIGTIFEKKKQYEKAHEYFIKGLNFYEDLQSNAGIILAYNNLGNNAIQWGEYYRAEQFLLKAQQLLEDHKNLKSFSHNQKMLANLYEKKGNLKKALAYLKMDIALTDSILGIEKRQAIANLEVKFETEKVKRDKDILEKKATIITLENQKNRTLLTASSVIIILLLIAGFFYISRVRAKREMALTTLELEETKKRLTLEKQYQDSELRALKAQMNPHFIFNALNSVQDYIITNNRGAASEYLGRFADLIRRYLVQSDSEYITLEEEVNSLQTYLSLEALRFEDNFRYKVSLSNALEQQEYHIPTMLIQPFVENAITHGLLHKEGKRTLLISFTKGKGQTILCVIEDNGIGREETKKMKVKNRSQHKSFSINAIQERLRLFSEKSNEKIEYTIIDLKDGENALGTKVIITIPIKKIHEDNNY